MNTNVLVLGGAGFIGSNIVGELLPGGATITVLDGFIRHAGADIANLSPYLPDITIHRERIERCKDLPRLIAENDLIIDCMALTSHHIGMDRPMLDVRANLVPHICLIEALRGTTGKRVIYLGSRGQYGRVDDPVITEDTPQLPIDSQGIDKSAAESFFRIYAGRHNFSATSLRISNCFGVNQKVRGHDIGLVGSFIKDILAGREVEVFGDSGRRKNLIFGGDLAKIVAKVAALDSHGFEAFNVSGHDAPISDVLDCIIAACDRGSYTVKPFPEEIRKIDVGGAVFSDEKLADRTGPTRLTDLASSIEQTVTYFKERMGG
jgi:nucleoside-diphosphate-sugar epimerase